MTKEEKRHELRKKGSVLAFAAILACILTVIVLAVLGCSPEVSSTCTDVTGVVIDRSHAVIAAVVAVLAGIMTFLLRHYAAR